MVAETHGYPLVRSIVGAMLGTNLAMEHVMPSCCLQAQCTDVLEQPMH